MASYAKLAKLGGWLHLAKLAKLAKLAELAELAKLTKLAKLAKFVKLAELAELAEVPRYLAGYLGWQRAKILGGRLTLTGLSWLRPHRYLGT